MSEFPEYSLYSNRVYEEKTIYSSSLTPPPISNEIYESKEFEYIHKKIGTRVMVKKIVKGDIIIHYTTTKNDYGYGWTRKTIVFINGDEDPYPVDL